MEKKRQTKSLWIFSKQSWIWSMGDASRSKDRSRYTSTFGSALPMETTSNPIRYSTGDNQNMEVGDSHDFKWQKIFLIDELVCLGGEWRGNNSRRSTKRNQSSPNSTPSFDYNTQLGPTERNSDIESHVRELFRFDSICLSAKSGRKWREIRAFAVFDEPFFRCKYCQKIPSSAHHKHRKSSPCLKTKTCKSTSILRDKCPHKGFPSRKKSAPAHHEHTVAAGDSTARY